MAIILANGRGQLGETLRREMKDKQINEDVYIYHTWNIDDKSKETQRNEHYKFIDFLRDKKNSKIIFISTSSEKESWYVYYKHLSEAHLLKTCKFCTVIRLPTLIGKGIFVKLKNKTVEPYGEMNIMSIKEASRLILEKVDYNGLLRTFAHYGETIKAKTAQEILLLE